MSDTQPIRTRPDSMEESLHLKPQPPNDLRPSQLIDIVLWLLRRRRRFRVVGQSMEPLLTPQQEVLINPRAYLRQMPNPGDLVVAQHPHKSDLKLIKWVVYVEDNQCFLKGLNSGASTDSRNFGLVSKDHLLGQVLCRFP